MGRHKLLLPWRGKRVIDWVLEAWTESDVDLTVIVVRKDDDALAEACQAYPVRVERPAIDPADMKGSVRVGLRSIASTHSPGDRDRCFIAPADLPTLTSSLINRLVASDQPADRIAVPFFGDEQGHPVLFPWPTTEAVFGLGDDEGVDKIVDRHQKFILQLPAEQSVDDIDTPADFRALGGRFPGTSESD